MTEAIVLKQPPVFHSASFLGRSANGMQDGCNMIELLRL
jgi:hypothetical protein